MSETRKVSKVLFAQFEASVHSFYDWEGVPTAEKKHEKARQTWRKHLICRAFFGCGRWI